MERAHSHAGRHAGTHARAATQGTHACANQPSSCIPNAPKARARVFFYIAVDNLVVLEDLASHAQRLLHHHTQPVAALAMSPDAKVSAPRGIWRPQRHPAALCITCTPSRGVVRDGRDGFARVMRVAGQK